MPAAENERAFFLDVFWMKTKTVGGLEKKKNVFAAQSVRGQDSQWVGLKKKNEGFAAQGVRGHDGHAGGPCRKETRFLFANCMMPWLLSLYIPPPPLFSCFFFRLF